MQDISEVIRHLHRAVQMDMLCRPGSRIWEIHFCFASDAMETRGIFQRQSNICSIAVQFTPNGHTDLAARLSTLGVSYSWRFEHWRHAGYFINDVLFNRLQTTTLIWQPHSIICLRFERKGDMRDAI
jgi:hypothetical protein